jgi:histidinol-phosphate aminotransferase
LVWPPGDGEAVAEGLRARGILVRSMARKPVIAESFRLTIGTMSDMERFMAAFARVIGRGE